MSAWLDWQFLPKNINWHKLHSHGHGAFTEKSGCHYLGYPEPLYAHIASATKKFNKCIGLIKCFSGQNFEKFAHLFKGIIRPIIEYGSPVWNPWLAKDIVSLEKVQQRCYSLANDYESHTWLWLAPCSLEKRRKIADLCEVYKYVHALYRCTANNFLNSPIATPEATHSRSHSTLAAMISWIFLQ